jgi:hypothetical protein
LPAAARELLLVKRRDDHAPARQMLGKRLLLRRTRTAHGLASRVLKAPSTLSVVGEAVSVSASCGS